MTYLKKISLYYLFLDKSNQKSFIVFVVVVHLRKSNNIKNLRTLTISNQSF